MKDNKFTCNNLQKQKQNPRQKQLVKWKYSRWLCVSSCFLLLPAYYAYSNKLYFLSVLTSCTSLISANYWRNPIYSWRRYCDLVFAKLAFFAYLYNYNHVKWVPYIIVVYSGLAMSLYCYYKANRLFAMKKKSWLKYHIMFHVIITQQQMIILHSLL